MTSFDSAAVLAHSSHLDYVLDDCYDRILTGRIHSGITLLVSELSLLRKRLGREPFHDEVAARCLNHPIRNYIHQCPFARRCFTKPRGYAGDAVIIDYFYGYEGPEQSDTPIGRTIFQVSMTQSMCESARYRRVVLAQKIDEVAQSVCNAQIVSVACGHLRELDLSNAIRKGYVSRFIALDQDAESVALVKQEAERRGLPVEVVCASVAEINRRKFQCNDVNLIYAAGLYDYLRLPTARRLTSRMFDMLASGGKLLVANYTPDVVEHGYMEAFMDWNLIYRNECEAASFMDEIDASLIQDMRLFRDPQGNVLYLELTRL